MSTAQTATGRVNRLRQIFWRRRPADAGSTQQVALEKVGQKPAGSGGKILIIDDDPVILKGLSLKLAAQGYVAVTAIDGSEGIAALRDVKPDIVLLDVNFPPDMCSGGGIAWDGLQIMSWLQKFEEAKGVAFIVITGGDPALYREKALKAGAVAFFQKPVVVDELLRCIKEAVERKARTGLAQGGG